MKHQRGDEIRLRADVQNKLEEFALGNLFGAKGVADLTGRLGTIAIRAKNTSETVIEQYATCMLGSYVVNPDLTTQGKRDPSIEVDQPTWPEIFGSIAVALEPIPGGKFGQVAIGGYCPATVNVISSSDGFAAPDYSEPKQLKSCDTGEVRIIGSPGTGVKTVLVNISSPHCVLWMYKRTADYPGEAVLLYGMQEQLFSGAGTVLLKDTQGYMDDQVTDDFGHCVQLGRRFVALQAVC